MSIPTTSMTLILLLAVLAASLPQSRAAFNYMGCAGVPPWEVDNNASSQVKDQELIQDWLHARQHSAARCKQYGTDNFLPGLGIGNTYLRAVIAMSRAVESGKIYRPGIVYFWAATTQDCTYGIQSLDCYFQGLSSCGVVSQGNIAPLNEDDKVTALGALLPSPNPDICQLAMTLKKPLVWVAGQYLAYIIRPRHDVQHQISARTKTVFSGVDKHRQSTIAVHYRAGKPDFNRKVLSLDEYMKHVKVKAAELASEGRPVSVVYLASQNNLNVFHNESYMTQTYGGDYAYKFLPPLAVSDAVDNSNEIELELKAHPEVARDLYVIEFLSDFELFVKADCFIGSVSTIYMIAMLMRYAKHPARKKGYTCLVSIDAELVCEDNPKKHQIFTQFNYWILGNGGGGEDRAGGFVGGTPY